jgi:hypothetical protein
MHRGIAAPPMWTRVPLVAANTVTAQAQTATTRGGAERGGPPSHHATWQSGGSLQAVRSKREPKGKSKSRTCATARGAGGCADSRGSALPLTLTLVLTGVAAAGETVAVGMAGSSGSEACAEMPTGASIDMAYLRSEATGLHQSTAMTERAIAPTAEHQRVTVRQQCRPPTAAAMHIAGSDDEGSDWLVRPQCSCSQGGGSCWSAVSHSALEALLGARPCGRRSDAKRNRRTRSAQPKTKQPNPIGHGHEVTARLSAVRLMR